MTVAAPPRPPQPSDSAGHDDLEALIEEARQRQRRRRRRYAAAAALVMLIGVSLSIAFARPGPSQNVDLEPSPPQAAAVDRDEVATLIAHHWAFHRAYVLIYDDGRAIVALDIGVAFNSPSIPTFERHLTPAGADLVRSGAIEARSVLEDMLLTHLLVRRANMPSDDVVSATSASSLPAGTWAGSEYRRWRPSRYAVCPDVGLDTAMRIANRRLPAAAALLRGKERTYNNTEVLLDPEDRGEAPVRCFDLSTEETVALRTALTGAAYPEPWDDMDVHHLPLADGADMWAQPILPHGEPVAWLG